MNRCLGRLAFALTLSLSISRVQTHAAIISTVPVGNVGNPADTTGLGAVGYAYRIGTHEVTNSQYAEFLNAKASTSLGFDLRLYSSLMGSNIRGGITQTFANGSFSYAAKPNMGDKPVNFVTWYDSIRFANWLHNGRGTGDTETGAYTLLGGTEIPSNSQSITRNPGATWFLPSENEWYKAAYHQPATQGGPSGDYWFLPTKSNFFPTVAAADSSGSIFNPGPNVANYNRGADWNGQDGNVTSVGSAGPLSASSYGTFDQGGNVTEWNEQIYSGGARRGLRGGSWLLGSDPLTTLTTSFDAEALLAGNQIGFRVATVVPEPSAILLAAFTSVALCWRNTTARKPQ